jgi:hypothetical protein
MLFPSLTQTGDKSRPYAHEFYASGIPTATLKYKLRGYDMTHPRNRTEVKATDVGRNAHLLTANTANGTYVPKWCGRA